MMPCRWALHSLAVAVMLGAAATARADDLPAETVQAATEAGVRVDHLWGAVISTGMPPYEYLYMTGELQRPAPACSWPFCGYPAGRIYCIERIESNHGRYMGPNPIGLWNSILRRYEHAAGWLGWLPSTAARWGVQVGNRASEWRGATAILAEGERFARTQFYGVGAGYC